MNLGHRAKLIDELMHCRLILANTGAKNASLLKILNQHVQRVWSKLHLTTIVRIILLGARIGTKR